jgi:hypothetical protein
MVFHTYSTKSPLDQLWSSPSQRCAQLILIVLTGQVPIPIDQVGSIRYRPYCQVAPPEEANVISSHIDNLQCASSNIRNSCHHTFRFLYFILLLPSLPLKPKAQKPVVRKFIIFPKTREM